MDISETSMAVHYQYHGCLSKELIKHWKDLYNASDKLPDKFSDKFYDRLAGNYPWFGDMLFFWSDVQKHTSASIFEEFPLNIRENLKEISIELDYILPKTSLTQAFLPVLITCYVFNRRKTNLSFIKALYEKNSLNDGNIPDLGFDRGLKYLSTIEMKAKYSKLSPKDVSLKDAKRARAVYLNIIQFFIFLLSFENLCNMALSFYTFECMTGYLHLLGDEANDIIREFDKKKPSEILQMDTTLNARVYQYANSILQDFYTIRIKKGQRSGKAK